MRDFLFYTQIAAIVLLIIESGFIIINLSTGLQKYLLINSISTLLNSLGYFVAIQATTLEGYLSGLKMSYAGRVWVPFSFLLLANALCKKKNRKRIMLFLALIHLFILMLVITCNYHSLYYVNMHFDTTGLFPSIRKDNGIFYRMYHYVIVAYIIYGIIILLQAIMKEKKQLQRTRLLFFFSAVITESAFYIIEILGFNTGFDDTVLGYAIGSIFMFIAIVKYSLLDTLKKASDYAIDEVSEGIVITNKNDEIEYLNLTSKIIFPGIENNPSKFLERIKTSIETQKPLTIGEKIYIPKERDLIEDNNVTGTIYVLIDDTEHQKYTEMISDYNHKLEIEVNEKTRKIRDIQQRTILGMAQMVESRDLSTGGHIKRTSMVVSVFSKALLKADMGFIPEFLNFVERSAPMHDLGKIAVDDSILRKQAKFTDEEYEIMKKHSAAGATIVKDILTGIEDDEFVQIATNVAHYHHEKVNGKGYPAGLSGDEIPVEARIMALADVFDALVSKRCYKDAFSYDKAFSIIQEDSGSHFDSKLAKVFIECRSELETLYNSFV